MAMNDTDRGAYTPHHDAPLAFDARRPSDRRPLPMTLIASAAVLVAIVAALVLAYRGGVRGSEAPKPVGEPVGAIKTAAAPEGPAEADPKLDVYAAQNVPAAAPNFAPPPEAPMARPAPAPAPQLQVRTVDTRMRIETPEAAPAPAPAPAPVISRPVQTAAAAPAAVKAPVQTAGAPAAATTITRTPSATAPAAAVAAPAAPKGGSPSVQIGAFSSRALADKGFADSSALVAAAGHGRAVEQVERDGKTFYRATLTGFADKAAAKAFCDKLAAKGGRCMVKN